MTLGATYQVMKTTLINMTPIRVQGIRACKAMPADHCRHKIMNTYIGIYHVRHCHSSLNRYLGLQGMLNVKLEV